MRAGHIHLEQGKKVHVKVGYGQGSAGPVKAQLIGSKYDPRPSPETIQAARNADVVVAVLGITSELEGQEMPVSEEGFTCLGSVPRYLRFGITIIICFWPAYNEIEQQVFLRWSRSYSPYYWWAEIKPQMFFSGPKSNTSSGPR